MRTITYRDALREALREEMTRDERVFVMGEDIGEFGGAFNVTLGLYDEFGGERVRDTPITEAAIMGSALGAAITGMRPVPEIMFSDFLPAGMDQLINQIAKIRYMSGGVAKAPLVIRTQNGAGSSAAAQHSQSLTALFAHVPGLRIAVPATAYDAKGLLKTAIRSDDPVLFFEHKQLYDTESEVPEEEYLIPFGQADVKRAGSDVTVVAISWMVKKTLNAAEDLSGRGIDVEVIDPRTICPLDKQTILGSVEKTGHLVIVEEDVKTNGLGAEIAAIVADEGFDTLDAPVKRVAAHDTPIPFNPALEDFVIPNEQNIIDTVEALCT